MKIRGYYVGFGRGATAYELQIHRFGMRITHLRGRYWAWRPWRRVTFQWFTKEQC